MEPTKETAQISQQTRRSGALHRACVFRFQKETETLHRANPYTDIPHVDCRLTVSSPDCAS